MCVRAEVCALPAATDKLLQHKAVQARRCVISEWLKKNLEMRTRNRANLRFCPILKMQLLLNASKITCYQFSWPNLPSWFGHILFPGVITMHLSRQLPVLLLTIGALYGCSSESESGGTPNENYNWPALIIGETINFTVVNGSEFSVEGVISYTYDSNGSVTGRNPETGAVYTPDSYTYSASGGTAYINLDYFGGAAYENYVLTAEDCDSGTYSLESFDSVVTATSTGTYQVVTTGTCTGITGQETQSTLAGVSVWTSECGEGTIDVYINGDFKGTLNSCYGSAPDFASSGTITTTDLTPGSYTIEGIAAGASWGPSSVTLGAGDELMYEFR